MFKGVEFFSTRLVSSSNSSSSSKGAPKAPLEIPGKRVISPQTDRQAALRAVIRFGLRAIQVCLEFNGSWIQWLFCLEILTLFLYLFSKLFVTLFVWLCFTIVFTILLSNDWDSDFFFAWANVLCWEWASCAPFGPPGLHLGLLGSIWDFSNIQIDKRSQIDADRQTDRQTDR